MKIVLIHGAWHDGSLWKDVADPLRAAGHEVHTPTLAGNGAGDIDRTIGHNDAVQSALDYIEAKKLNDFVLLGHSYGGSIISKMAEAIPSKIRRLVYWNAFVLEDGESIEDVAPPYYKTMLDEIVASGAYGQGAVKLPFPVWREAFMNDASLELAQKTYEITTPHPLKTFKDKVELKTFPSLTIPRSYINCTEDIAMPKGEFSWTPRFLNRLGLCRLVQMPGGHEACFTNPKLLAEKIIEAARD
ncbi:MAG: alpha/beta fold hydrolase [Alphaproteobacteria bacterium]|nr:alpha/beta fold hydrolase [Alphaproteobacteria bacterium]